MVTVTGPAVVQVKVVLAAVAALNWPRGADPAEGRVAGIGPVAVTARATELPTLVSTGLAVTSLHAAQSNDVPLTRVVCPPAPAALPAICTDTCVVARAMTANVAEPSHDTPPSVEAAETTTR